MKKKIMLLSIFIISLFCVLVSVDKKEVKAEDNCETVTYYYMFLEATTKYQYEERFNANNDSFDYSTTKYFKVPDEISDEEFDVYVAGHGKIDISYGDVAGIGFKLRKEMNLKDYHDVLLKFAESEQKNYNYGYTDSNNIKYLGALPWSKETQSEITTNNIPVEKDFETFRYSVPVFGVGGGYVTAKTTFSASNLVRGSAPSVTKVEVNGEEYKSVSIDISRSYAKSDLTSIGSYPSAGNDFIVWTPAVYYVDYEICPIGEEPEPEEEPINLTVHHYEEGTTNQLWDDYTDSDVAGEEYSYQCRTIPGYNVIDSDEYPALIEGTYVDEDIEEICYYKKATYVLTVNYGEDPDCTSIIKTADSYDLEYGEKRDDISVPDKIGKLNNPKIGSFSDKFNVDPVLKGTNLSVEMPAKNVQVCIMYTGQLGISWIYFAWIIGGLSLGYSAWYFVRYYKKRNSEI